MMLDTDATRTFVLHGKTPERIVAPCSAEELAAILAQANADGAGVVPWGSGTRQHIGYAPRTYTLALSTARLARVVEYSPADLVLTVEAGMTLGAVQTMLAQHDQWLPWNPPCADQAGIGGLLATGATGPLRQGYGTPRDWTLGLRVALADGRLVKSGAKVVKNVAGYDTHKLHLGALGTLGVIAEATFKLAPLPACRRTMLVSFTEPRPLVIALMQLHAPPLSPISLVSLNDTAAQKVVLLQNFMTNQPRHLTLVARFAGVSNATERQMRVAAQRCVELGARCIELDEQDDEPLWQELANFSAPVDDGSLLLRAGASPGRILDLGRILEQSSSRRGWPVARMHYAGIGLAFARWWPPDGTKLADINAVLAELRAALSPIGGYLVVEAAPSAWRPMLDLWGPAPETLPLMKRLKAVWDPNGILNPGRYMV